MLTSLIALLIAGKPPVINLTDIHNVDMLPACVQEDCSDQPGQVGLWTNEGNTYLIIGETETYLVVDNTIEGIK